MAEQKTPPRNGAGETEQEPTTIHNAVPGDVAVDTMSEASEPSTSTSEALQATLTVTSQAVRAEVEQLAADLKSTAKATAADVGVSVSQQAKARSDEIKESATARTHQVKEVAAEKIHASADTLRNRAVLPQAQAIDAVADRIDGASDYVRQKDYTEMKGDFEHLVQDAPMIAVILAFLVGILLGTLLKRG